MRMAGCIWIGVLVTALTLVVAAPRAQAGDGHCGCSPCDGRSVYATRGPVGRTCHPTRSRSHRNPCHPSTRYVVPRYNRGARRYGCGQGSPWSVLRRHLPGYGASPAFRRAYVRSFFLRRYPFAKAEAEAAEVERMDILLAEAEVEPEAQAKLPPEARMNLGMARFYTADYVGARADFEAVLAATPKSARARYGRLLCSLCTSDWKHAASDLNVLARQGEMRAEDRLDAEGCFSDPSVVDAVVAGLRGHARYKVCDGEAWLVTAWALSVRGEAAKARTCARLARRWHASGTALSILEQNLGLRETPTPTPPPQPTREAPVPAPAPRPNVIATKTP